MGIENDTTHPLGPFSFTHAGQCLNCARYNGGKQCGAYPQGIPDLIFDDVVQLDRSLGDDQGLTFLAKNPLDAEGNVRPYPYEED